MSAEKLWGISFFWFSFIPLLIIFFQAMTPNNMFEASEIF